MDTHLKNRVHYKDVLGFFILKNARPVLCGPERVVFFWLYRACGDECASGDVHD